MRLVECPQHSVPSIDAKIGGMWSGAGWAKKEAGRSCHGQTGHGM